MTIARVTSKGQVTIPKEVREALGIRPGMCLDFRVREEGGLEVGVLTGTVDDVYGYLKRPGEPGLGLEEMEQAVAENMMREYRSQ